MVGVRCMVASLCFLFVFKNGVSTEMFSLNELKRCGKVCEANGYTHARCYGSRTAFFVRLTKGITAKYGHILIFPKVVTNLNNSYDVKTGKFVAPRSGTYRFDWSYMTNTYAYICGMVNKEIVQNTAVHSTRSLYNMSFGFMIVTLKKGDEVYAMACFKNSYFHGHFTFFAGHMLFE